MFVYRLVGLLATIALGTYALISYGLLVWLGATLTLPGLAGFVLAIGLAIDANVLVFERAREEYAERTAARALPALNTGFNKAWSAIIDSNVTTLLAAALLFFFASGPVKGFGVTLSIGVIASMVSALVVARVLTEWAMRRVVRPQAARASAGSRHRPGPHVADRERARPDEAQRHVDRRRRSSSAVRLDRRHRAPRPQPRRRVHRRPAARVLHSQPVDVEDAREAVSDAGFPKAVVQSSSGDGGEENITRPRRASITNDEAVEIEQALATVAGDVEKERDELIGPSLGKELRDKALIAFGDRDRRADDLSRVAVPVDVRRGGRAGDDRRVVLTVVGVFAWLGQADRRGVPGRGAVDHRPGGQRHDRGVRPDP